MDHTLVDNNRPHRSNSINNNNNNTPTATSELFICFTSRLSSSSSMKLSSKSILSPGHPREPSQISLSTSLSRRLRTNGSIKGSPMFPKKRGCGYENPEPSSPKVTCIGQVRVKTKKQSKKLRTRSGSTRRSSGDVSFRRLGTNNGANHLQDCISGAQSHGLSQDCSLPHRNQRWVHLPLTICEALRAFGAEFKCLLPCKSTCFEKENKPPSVSDGSGTGTGGSSCGAVFARWLVAVQEGECKERDIELVVGEEREEEDKEESEENVRSYRRRHVFEEIDFKEDRFNGGNGESKEEGRVSICIPPKNALLLMRCRSDPVKMATLTNKFWEPQPYSIDDEEEEENEDKNGDEKVEIKHNEFLEAPCPVSNDIDDVDKEVMSEQVEQEMDKIEEAPVDAPEDDNPNVDQDRAIVVYMADDDNLNHESCGDMQAEETELVREGNVQVQEQEKEDSVGEETLVQPVVTDQNHQLPEVQAEAPATETTFAEEDASEEQCEQGGSKEEETVMTHERSEPEDPETQEDSQMDTEKLTVKEEQQKVLPDCLLLMMCEPKLSMEVSKETWVCSTDFIRWLPEKSKPAAVKQTNGGDEAKKRISVEVNAVPVKSVNLQQPPRSSCSYPAKPPNYVAGAGAGADSVGSENEKKLKKGYEPLKRCKSEPRKTAAKLAPEACFWKNRKLEPHRPAAVGAAGVGF